MKRSNHLGVIENILIFSLTVRDSYCIGGLGEYFPEVLGDAHSKSGPSPSAPKDRVSHQLRPLIQYVGSRKLW